MWKLTSLALAGLAMTAMAGTAAASTLAVCTEGSPTIFNPELTNSGTTIETTAQIYDELVEIKPGTSEVQPALAESWKVSDDGKTYTFKLRHGVKWQSSDSFKPTRDFNADDVVFTFDRMMNAQNPYHTVSNGTYVTFNSKLADAIQSVTKVDDYTVEFKLKAPVAPFIEILAHQSLGITSAEYAAAMQKAGTLAKFDTDPIGTGPFSMVAYQQDALVRFAAFHQTWGEAIGDKARTPMVDDLVFAITTDPAVRLQRAEAGECQIMLYPNPGDAKGISGNPQLSLLKTPTPAVGFITFNFNEKPFQDLRVRQALAMAIDLKPLVEAVYQGTGTVTAAIVPSVLWGHNDKVQPAAYDPDKAKQLLQQAGYGNGFDTEIWAVPVSRPYMPSGQRAAEMIQQDWEKVGVHAKIVTYEWGEYIKRAQAGEAKVGMFGGIWDYPDPGEIPNNYFTCTNGKPSPSNIGQWCSAKMTDLVKQAEQIPDQQQRTQLIQQAQQLVSDEQPVVVLGSADTYSVASKTITGYTPAVFGATVYSGISVAQ